MIPPVIRPEPKLFFRALRSCNGLKQACACVVLKNLRAAHVTAQSVHALVAGLVRHFENARSTRCGRGQEAGPQRMTTEGRSIEPQAGGKRFDRAGYLLVG